MKRMIALYILGFVLIFYSCDKSESKYCKVNDTCTIWVYNNSDYNNVKVYIDNKYEKIIDSGEGFSYEYYKSGDHKIFCDVENVIYWKKDVYVPQCETFKFTLTNK